jgi:hypothetical protein
MAFLTISLAFLSGLLAQYKAQKTPLSQIRDFLMADCSLRLTLNEACNWLAPRISPTLLTQFKEHFSA